MYLLLGINLAFMFFGVVTGQLGTVLVSGFAVLFMSVVLLIENWNAKDGEESKNE
jgi:hypothetical protein